MTAQDWVNLFLGVCILPFIVAGRWTRRVIGAAALQRLHDQSQQPPPLVIDNHFVPAYFDHCQDSQSLRLEYLASDEQHALARKQVDVILSVPGDFTSKLRS